MSSQYWQLNFLHFKGSCDYPGNPRWQGCVFIHHISLIYSQEKVPASRRPEINMFVTYMSIQ